MAEDNLPAVYVGELLEPARERKLGTSVILEKEIAIPKPKSKWAPPTDPLEQAWKLREYLRRGKHALVLSCERTRQIDPEKPSSPVITCAPDNCEFPCFNCMIAVLTGQKRWV